MLRAFMARQPVSKELWQQLQPLIPEFIPSSKGGARKLGVSNEAALNGILYVLQTGIPWEDLPQALGYGSGMTCWRRLRDWSAAGVGSNCIRACLCACVNMTKLIGAEPVLMAHRCQAPGGPGNWPQPD